jgi:hypothetical protein
MLPRKISVLLCRGGDQSGAQSRREGGLYFIPFIAGKTLQALFLAFYGGYYFVGNF